MKCDDRENEGLRKGTKERRRTERNERKEENGGTEGGKVQDKRPLAVGGTTASSAPVRSNRPLANRNRKK